MQHLKLLEPGSDCGTKRYLEVSLTSDNIDDYMYSYIIEGSKLVELTSDLRDKYIGKKVKIRYSSMCEAKNGYFCSKCAGNLWYRLGIRHVGLITTQLPSRVKLVAMKSFHSNQVVLEDMNVWEAFMPDADQ